MATVDKSKVPWWVSNLIVPLVNLTLALFVSGLFIFIAGENPYEAVRLIIYGSFGYIEGFAYTLYYTTNFIFTGLAHLPLHFIADFLILEAKVRPI